MAGRRLEPYRCIVADPPWLERGGGRSKRGADRHYPLLHKHQILEAILRAPCWRPSDEGCHLWLWVTDNYLEDGLEVMRGLGFRYVRTAVWVKLAEPRINRLLDILNGDEEFDDAVDALRRECRRLQIGLGQYLRGSHELCLFGVRGKQPAAETHASALLEARTTHSTKPKSFYEMVELVSPPPRLELFARYERPGWTAWGNEVSDCTE